MSIAELKYNGPAIYKITNSINNKIYIGKASKFYNRYKHHKYNKLTTYISRAFSKYGFDNFAWEILEKPEIEALSDREHYYLDYYKSYKKEIGYNIRTSVDNNLGFRHSEATKKKISEHFKGVQVWHKGKTNVEALHWHNDRKLKHSVRMKGGNNPNAKAVIQYTLEGAYINEYPSCYEAGLASGANPKKIAAAASGYPIKKPNGKSYTKKTAGGYTWKWKSPQ